MVINLTKKDTIDLKIEITDMEGYTIRIYGIHYNVAYFNSSGGFGFSYCSRWGLSSLLFL